MSLEILTGSILKIFFIVCVIGSNESARILAVYPVPSISHQIVFRPLMQELVKRGHEVVVITADPAFPKGQAPENLTEIDVHDLSYKIWNVFLETGKAQSNNMNPQQIKIFFDVMLDVFEAQVKSENVQKLIRNKDKSFDLLFVEACMRPALSFAYLYKRDLPIIEFSSLGGLCGTFDETGAPTNYLVYPLPFRQKVYNLSLWEKITEVYNDYQIERACKEHEKSENKIVKRIFGPNTPDLRELKKNVQLIFLNVNPIWDFNRPVPPNIIYLGGIHQKPDRELPMDVKTYLDSSKNGVIYMSFGTNARPSLLPAEKLRIFTNVFSQLPYNILWKWDKEQLPNRSKNIRISKWLPQSDLLKHPKVKLFITQGGLQSTDEALTAGVPLIVIPFLGDQWFNAEHYVKLNIGLHLDLETITETDLKNAILNIIQDKTYRENVVKLNKLIRDQPQSPLERAVWWTEYVLRHGGATHLRAAGAHMHWTEYYALDILLLLLSASVALFMGILLVIRYVVSKVQNKNLKIKANKIN
ncbi:UDP-glucosyltransferase 2-like [Pararge aegeria]|uniref:UDP-glucosyltransferase 2-like n=1 Tax=Pararge aegeria TaxID=116150 RepID=UPI0019CFEAC8|nr:UDP-glucosyltransferase 2-like [Pararge aegeria]